MAGFVGTVSVWEWKWGVDRGGEDGGDSGVGVGSVSEGRWRRCREWMEETWDMQR